MLFSSLQFVLVFLPVFMIIYYLVPLSWKKFVLLIGSVIFYCIGDYYSFFIYLTSLIVNFGFNKLMISGRDEDSGNERKGIKILILILIVVWNVGILFAYKYWDFLASTIEYLTGCTRVPKLGLQLPLGISFYTFQVLSYQIDCYRGTVKRAASLLDFAVYMTMFPQLISGPIVRYTTVEEQLKIPYVNLTNLEAGMKTFAFGLGLKVLLANQISTLWNSIQISGSESISPLIAWLGAIAFSMQIYFDFWGYSVMAIGLGQMIGYKIPQNFKNPYIAKSISEFWRRWHITLGSWFREYLYFPLGGSRCSKLKTLRNLFLVWVLTGLWHGASWNFVLWGFILFFFMALEKLFLGAVLEKSKIVGHLYLFTIIPTTWVVFSKTKLSDLLVYLSKMFWIAKGSAEGSNQQLVRYLIQYWWLLLIGLFFMTPIPINIYKAKSKKWYMLAFLFGVFWFSIYELYIGKNNPFLYFGF